MARSGSRRGKLPNTSPMPISICHNQQANICHDHRLSHAHALPGAQRWTALLPRRDSGSPKARTTRRNALRPTAQCGYCFAANKVIHSHRIHTFSHARAIASRCYQRSSRLPATSSISLTRSSPILFLLINHAPSHSYITHSSCTRPYQLRAKITTAHEVKVPIATSRVRVRSLKASIVHVCVCVCVCV